MVQRLKSKKGKRIRSLLEIGYAPGDIILKQTPPTVGRMDDQGRMEIWYAKEKGGLMGDVELRGEIEETGRSRSRRRRSRAAKPRRDQSVGEERTEGGGKRGKPPNGRLVIAIAVTMCESRRICSFSGGQKFLFPFSPCESFMPKISLVCSGRLCMANP
jgi:hypothetical protein